MSRRCSTTPDPWTHCGRTSVKLVAVGVAVGAGLGSGVAPLLQSQFSGTVVVDLVTLVEVAVCLAPVAAVAISTRRSRSPRSIRRRSCASWSRCGHPAILAAVNACVLASQRDETGARHGGLYVIGVDQGTGEVTARQQQVPLGIFDQDVIQAEWADSGEILLFEAAEAVGKKSLWTVSRGVAHPPASTSSGRTRSIPGSGSRRTAAGRPTSTAPRTASSRCSGCRSAEERRSRSRRTPPTRPSPRGPRWATGSRSPSSATGPTSGASTPVLARALTAAVSRPSAQSGIGRAT